MPRLMIINGSIREGRLGGPIGEWVRKTCEADTRFTTDYADLAEIRLPLLDEPNHPRMKQYVRPATIAWSRRVEAADCFLMLFPEYNFSYSAPIKNALDHLVSEWDRKPVGFVNWGGNSGGTRAQVALRPVITALGMVLTHGNVEINLGPGLFSAEGTFQPTEQQTTVLGLQLDELIKLDSVLAGLRA